MSCLSSDFGDKNIKNDRFRVGQSYHVQTCDGLRKMRIESISGGFARFVDAADPSVRCSGEIFTVQLPSCQSCQINGADMVYSYDVLNGQN